MAVMIEWKRIVPGSEDGQLLALQGEDEDEFCSGRGHWFPYWITVSWSIYYGTVDKDILFGMFECHAIAGAMDILHELPTPNGKTGEVALSEYQEWCQTVHERAESVGMQFDFDTNAIREKFFEMCVPLEGEQYDLYAGSFVAALMNIQPLPPPEEEPKDPQPGPYEAYLSEAIQAGKNSGELELITAIHLKE